MLPALKSRPAPLAPTGLIVPNPAVHRITSLVARSAILKGDVEFGESVHCHGEILGNVTVGGESMLFSLSAHGKVAGNITAPAVLIEGEVTGNINASVVNIAPTAKITGEILYDRIVIAEGATLNCRQICNRKDVPIEHEPPPVAAEVRQFTPGAMASARGN